MIKVRKRAGQCGVGLLRERVEQGKEGLLGEEEGQGRLGKKNCKVVWGGLCKREGRIDKRVF